MNADVSKILARARRRGACLLWSGARYSNGYGKLYREAGRPRRGKRRRVTLLVHREVFRATRGPIPAAWRVVHTATCSGDKLCIEKMHLKKVPEPAKMIEWQKRWRRS